MNLLQFFCLTLALILFHQGACAIDHPPIFMEQLQPMYRPYSLSNEQIKHFEEYGYLVVPKFMKDAEVAILNDQSADLINEIKNYLTSNAHLSTNSRFEYKGSSVLVKNTKKDVPVIKLISWAGAVKPQFLEIGRSLTVLVPIAQLLGSYEMDHIINQIHPKEKGDEIAFDIHQDYQNRIQFDPEWKDINGRGSFVQLLIAIDMRTL